MNRLSAVIIHDGCVTCPTCSNRFEVKRKAGGGASYAKNWSKLSEQCMRILTVWVSHDDMRNSGFEKKDLRVRLANKGLMLNEDPFNARVSELLGLGLLISTGQAKSSPHNTSNAPVYHLNHEKVLQILNRGGKLS